MNKTSTVVMTLIAVLALGACSKRNSGGLRARAEVQKKSNDTKGGNMTYNDADAAIDESIAKLHSLGYKSINRGVMGAISTKVLFGNVKPEDRTEVKRLLNKIVRDADTQIGLAKDLTDKDEGKGQRERAEQIKANAQTGLEEVAKEEQNDKK